jgi:hypothetical protein
MSTLRAWFLETDPVFLIFLFLIILWFGAIIYNIPVQLYLDEKALKAGKRSTVLQERAEDLKIKED